MTIWERVQNLNKLQFKISKGDQGAIDELKAVYTLTTGKVLKRECMNCRIRAFHEIMSLTEIQINNIMSDNKNHKLKEGKVVYFGHTHYTNANIDDDVAKAMVKHNSKNADLFVNPPSVAAKEPAAPKEPKASKAEKEPKAAKEPAAPKEDENEKQD